MVALFPQTKFHPPAARPEHVERSALLGVIERSGAVVTAVAAPAGFGKSTLLGQWAARAAARARVAWVSIDEDDLGHRLWLAILTALHDSLGAELNPTFDAAEAPGADPGRRDVQVALLDALHSTSAPVALVLDDLHLVLDDAPTRAAFDWFLARVPRPHQVVLASRRDPALPALPRLRSRGDALDVRSEDLRFAAPEAAHFLTGMLGLELAAEDMGALTDRTEGWPAALYLSALRLRLGARPADVLAELHAGPEQLVGDLAEEVLRSCGEPERELVRVTAILARFNADLCVALLGRDDETRAAFTAITRASLLVTPLDHTRTWFRCHHLLRDALRSRLRAERPERVRHLHVRAGVWLESEGGEAELHEAMRHYLAGGEWNLAAELLATHSMRFVQAGPLGGRAREWLAQFPAEVARADARVCYVSALLSALDGDRALRDRWLEAGRRAGWEGPMSDGTASFALAMRSLEAMLCFDDVGTAVAAAHDALHDLPPGAPVRASVQALTAWHLHLLGDDAAAVTAAREAQLQFPTGTLPLVAYLPRAVEALCALRAGDIDTARRLTAEAEAARDAGPMRGSPHALPVTCAAARLLTATGRPDEAADRCRAGLGLARGWRDSSLMIPAVLIELVRACAAAGDRHGAEEATAEARRWLDGARDPGRLRAALAEATHPRRPLATPDPLSAREIEVLRALEGTGSLRAIAGELFISHNTVKTHTRSLYQKLGVSSRPAAVRRAQGLGLLDAVKDRR